MNHSVTSLSVLSFNTWGLQVGAVSIARSVSERIRRIAGEINSLQPDVVAFQEVWTEESAHKLMTLMDYPYFSYHPARRAIRGNVGNGLLFFSRYPIVEEHQFTYTRYTQWFEFFSNKGVLMIKIETSAGYIQLFNTHLGSGKKPLHTAQRLGQINELQKYILQFTKQYPSLLLGDLNFNPSMKEYGLFRQWINDHFTDRCLDTFADVNPDSPGFTFYKQRSFKRIISKHDQDERIDYIFALKSKENRCTIDTVDSAVVLDQAVNPLSDHCGVMTTFEITRRKTLNDIMTFATPQREKIGI